MLLKLAAYIVLDIAGRVNAFFCVISAELKKLNAWLGLVLGGIALQNLAGPVSVEI